jgi:hypothetical protein
MLGTHESRAPLQHAGQQLMRSTSSPGAAPALEQDLAEFYQEENGNSVWIQIDRWRRRISLAKVACRLRFRSMPRLSMFPLCPALLVLFRHDQ